MLNGGPKRLKQIIFMVFKSAFQNESGFSNLKNILIKPILKDRDGDLHDAGNFRPIALLSQLFKLYEAVLNWRLIE